MLFLNLDGTECVGNISSFPIKPMEQEKKKKKKTSRGPIFNGEKRINPVWVTHNTVKTVSSSLEVRILFVR